jgi:hypothetical protein
MVRKTVQTPVFLGATNQLGEFIKNHSAILTEKGVKPEDLTTKVNTCCSTVQTAEQEQADAKTALKSATATLNETVSQRYSEFSSVIDLLRGAVGNNTPLGKQLTNIRKQINKRGRSANIADVNNVTTAKIAA